MSDFNWNEAAVARLRVLWDEGHSTAQIGRLMGATKNSVVGKARRIGLDSRPSPIPPRGSGKPRPAPRAPARTLPPLASVAQQEAAPPPIVHEPSAPITLTSKPCQYPLWGNNEKPTHKYCDKPSVFGLSYCPSCAKTCYVQRSASPAMEFQFPPRWAA